MLTYFIIVSPNLSWLWQHDFAAFSWIDSQIKREFNPKLLLKLSSIYYPLLFLWWILHRSQIKLQWPKNTNKRILLWVALLPQTAIWLWFLFNHGGRLTEWLQPFFIIAPALVVSCVKDADAKPFRKANTLLMSSAAIVIFGYVIVMVNNVGNAGRKMSGVIPFSLEAEMLWQNLYGTPMRFVGGEHLAEWLTFYAPSRPVIITKWNDMTKPNIYNSDIKLSDIRRSGALLVGNSDIDCSQESFSKALNQWPQLYLDAVTVLNFKQGERDGNYPVCIGFVKPIMD